MTMASALYEHGVAIVAQENACCASPGHSNDVTVKFALEGRWSQLSAKIGLDDALNRDKMDVRFYTDKRSARELSFNPGDPPQALQLKVAGVQTLTVVVSNLTADGSTSRGQVDFVDPVAWR
jgi:hypothetical protein